jgi:fructose-specific phosphotransferase system component IIB
MIRYFLLFLLSFTLLQASKILSYNVYDRTDRVDVMITFDTPYEGTIKQSSQDSSIIIKLENAQIESTKSKTINSDFITSLQIVPMGEHTQIVAKIPSVTELKASKTADAYGLRLRFTAQASPKQATQTSVTTPKALFSSLPTKKDDDISKSYYIVITILIIGILILFLLKRKITTKQEKPSSWLFAASTQKSATAPSVSHDVSIRFQKTIDEKNSVVMLDFSDQSYLVLVGGNNILLDKFTDNKPVTQDEFETILKNRHQELDEFLRVEKADKNPLASYKEKASSISYEV